MKASSLTLNTPKFFGLILSSHFDSNGVEVDESEVQSVEKVKIDGKVNYFLSTYDCPNGVRGSMNKTQTFKSLTKLLKEVR